VHEGAIQQALLVVGQQRFDLATDFGIGFREQIQALVGRPFGDRLKKLADFLPGLPSLGVLCIVKRLRCSPSRNQLQSTKNS